MTDLTNRRHGAASARVVVYCGFAVGIAASLYFADTRIALASGTAFLVAQLFDVAVFDRLREQTWWIAPLISSILSTVLGHLALFQSRFFTVPKFPGPDTFSANWSSNGRSRCWRWGLTRC